jgi:arylsulfatase
MVIAWPGHIPPGGAIRDQFTHCIDIAPTILDLVGIPEPKTVDGIVQEPMDGTPFTYTLDDPAAAERMGTAARDRGARLTWPATVARLLGTAID